MRHDAWPEVPAELVGAFEWGSGRIPANPDLAPAEQPGQTAARTAVGL